MHTRLRQSLSPKSSHRFFVLNVGLAGVFALLAVLVIMADLDATVPLRFTSYVRDDDDDVGYRVVTQEWTSIRLSYLSCVFLALAALDHAAMCIFRSYYEEELAEGRNSFRWIEYSMSASIMNVQIAMLSGMLEIQPLICIAVLTALCQLGGAMEERFGSTPEVRIIGFVPFIIAWGLIASNFSSAMLESTGSVPGFVVAIVIVLFLLESLFAVNQLRPVTRYEERELGFLVLSIVSKATLAGLVWGGLLSLTK